MEVRHKLGERPALDQVLQRGRRPPQVRQLAGDDLMQVDQLCVDLLLVEDVFVQQVWFDHAAAPAKLRLCVGGAVGGWLVVC